MHPPETDGHSDAADGYWGKGVHEPEDFEPEPKPEPEEEDDDGGFNPLDFALDHAFDATPLRAPLDIANQISPGFRRDFSEGAIVDTAKGAFELGKTGVRLSPIYGHLDPEGQREEQDRLADAARYAWNDPLGFAKTATGLDYALNGQPGRFAGGLTAAAATGGTAGAVSKTGTALRGLTRATNGIPDPPRVSPPSTHGPMPASREIGKRTPDQLAHRAQEILGDSDDVVVLGRTWDTEVAHPWPGHMVLKVDDWELGLNDAVIGEIAAQRRRVYLGSPLKGNLRQTSGSHKGEPSIFARELMQLKKAGYRKRGDWMEPPP